MNRIIVVMVGLIVFSQVSFAGGDGNSRPPDEKEIKKEINESKDKMKDKIEKLEKPGISGTKSSAHGADGS